VIPIVKTRHRQSGFTLVEILVSLAIMSVVLEMLGNTWYWKTVVQRVEDDDLRRVDIEIRRLEDAQNPMVRVAGFIAHPRLRSRNASTP